jgi:hypothetical protein
VILEGEATALGLGWKILWAVQVLWAALPPHFTIKIQTFFFTDCVNICTRGGAPGDHEHGGGEEHTTMNDETPSTSS